MTAAIIVVVLGILVAAGLNYLLRDTVDKWRDDSEIED